MKTIYRTFEIGWSATERLASVIESPEAPVALLGAIVQRVKKVEDGDVIVGLEPAWREISKILSSNPLDLFKLDPQKWEELVASSYEKAGYEVVLTPRSGDFGRDVIATKSGWGSIRIIDQVKAFKSGHRVTANDVRALLGVLSADPSATKAVFTTTSEFAPRIMEDKNLAAFIPYRLELCDGKNLIERLRFLSRL